MPSPDAQHLLTQLLDRMDDAGILPADVDCEAPTPLGGALVALADRLWRGKRDTAQEDRLIAQLAAALHQPTWQLLLTLDDIATDLTRDAARLAYQG